MDRPFHNTWASCSCEVHTLRDSLQIRTNQVFEVFNMIDFFFFEETILLIDCIHIYIYFLYKYNEIKLVCDKKRINQIYNL